MRWMVLVVMVAGCSSSEEAEPPPSACRQSDRTGTYRTVAVEEPGGTCGPIPTNLGRLDSGKTALPAQCSVVRFIWSESDCKLETGFTCAESGGRTSTGSGVTRQQTADGSRIQGTSSLTISNADGSTACISTYSITATRQ